MARFQQEKILYTREWNQEVDTVFVRKLESEALGGRIRGGSDNSQAIRTAMEAVNTSLAKDFSFTRCCEQFSKLRRRHKVFAEILSKRGVWLDVETNSMFYETETWEEINRIDPLVVAYKNKGDPEMPALRIIFREDDDSVGFFDLQDITHLSSNLDGLSDPQRYQYPRYGFDDRLSNSFWSYVGRPSSQGECNTSSTAQVDSLHGVGSVDGETKPVLKGGSEEDKRARS